MRKHDEDNDDDEVEDEDEGDDDSFQPSSHWRSTKPA